MYFDQNDAAAGKKFHALGGIDVSPDGQLLLYLEDTTAFRNYTLYVKNLESGQIVDRDPRRLERHRLGDDNRTFFYMTADSAKRGNAVWRHVIGTPAGPGRPGLQENDVLNDVGLPLPERQVRVHFRRTATPRPSGA